MSKSVIIIPTRLKAKRLPNKPLLKINNIPIIIHVMERAKESKIGDVIVATPDKEISDLVEKNYGKVIITSKDHSTGTDRVYEALQKFSDDEIDIVINLQGDMPNLDPKSIINLNNLMRKSNFKIGTLASSLKKNEFYDNNVVKVYVQNKLEKFNFYRAKALDFFRQPGLYHKIEKLYHHIGIYAFRIETLSKYVKLKRTKNEIRQQKKKPENKTFTIRSRVILL